MSTPPSLACARAMRDGGIDAVAALNDAVRDAIANLPPEQAREVKLAFGRAMSAVIDETINPAVQAFPELEPDEATWAAIAKAKAASRSSV